MLSSCRNQTDSDSGLISTDVVNNPNSAEGNVDINELPEMEFDETNHNFGKVIQGEVVTYGFRFKNTGNSDLLITRVSTTCGCTATEYPRVPVEPGGKGVIKITFDSKGRKGVQRKSATVLANTQPNRITLEIKAIVFIPEE